MNRGDRNLRRRRAKHRELTSEERVDLGLLLSATYERQVWREDRHWAMIVDCMEGEHYGRPMYKPLSLDQWEVAELRRRDLRARAIYTTRIARTSGDSYPRRSRREYWTLRMLPDSAYDAKHLTRYAEGGEAWPGPMRTPPHRRGYQY
jgi:hypothetical protein